MPLNVRSISIRFAVICFFVAAVAGSLSKVSPFTCCKRALIGAVVGYVIGSIVTKAINAILISAMVQEQMNERREQADGSES